MFLLRRLPFLLNIFSDMFEAMEGPLNIWKIYGKGNRNETEKLDSSSVLTKLDAKPNILL